MNDNCLAGFRCPKCGSEGPFDIATEDFTKWNDDGTWEQSEPSFAPNGMWYCCACKFEGKEEDFRRGFIEWLAKSVTKSNGHTLLADLVRRVKAIETQRLVECGDVAMLDYLVKESDPLSVIIDLDNNEIISVKDGEVEDAKDQ